MTLARGRRGPPSSPALWAAFSKDLSSWSTGAHSPRAASARSFCTASLLLAPADPGLLPGCGVPSALVPPDPSSRSLPVTGLSSLLEAFFLSSFAPPDALLLPLLLIAHPPRLPSCLPNATNTLSSPHSLPLLTKIVEKRFFFRSVRFSPNESFSTDHQSIDPSIERRSSEIEATRTLDQPRPILAIAKDWREVANGLPSSTPGFVARNEPDPNRPITAFHARRITVTRA